jgi:hypothetical protein
VGDGSSSGAAFVARVREEENHIHTIAASKTLIAVKKNVEGMMAGNTHENRLS